MKERWENKYVKLALTITGSGAVLILLYCIVVNHRAVFNVLANAVQIISPFIYGFVIAYLLLPIYNPVVRNVYRLTKNVFKKKKHALGFAKVIGTTVSLLILIGVTAGVIALVIPELFSSISGILQSMPEKMTELVNWIKSSIGGDYPEITRFIEKTLMQTKDSLVKWVENKILPKMGVYITQISQGLILTLKTVLNVFIGVVICAYVLNIKEVLRAKIRKFITASMDQETSDRIFEFAHFTNKTFGGFINGKIIDSLIMGFLCFIAMTVIRLPYSILVSTIVGITNIIPFFGPFIGAIPSAIIIFFENPVKALYFIIMILVLQQIDGSIIGPNILGKTTKLASFWVMFAIIVGGGLFGFIGMVLGVPVFSLIYYYFKKGVEKKLEKKGKPVKTSEYQNFDVYDIDRKDIL